MIKVKATREGLLGQRTASGYIVDKIVPFVALPATSALHRFVRIKYKDREAIAIVLDVGPWNVHDVDYVFKGERPLAEKGYSVSSQGTNGAGIDLGEKVWHTLGMTDNDDVEWEFIT